MTTYKYYGNRKGQKEFKQEFERVNKKQTKREVKNGKIK